MHLWRMKNNNKIYSEDERQTSLYVWGTSKGDHSNKKPFLFLRKGCKHWYITNINVLRIVVHDARL